MSNATIFTVVLPDGTTETCESNTETLTYAVAKFTSADMIVDRLRRSIARIADNIAMAEARDPDEMTALPRRLTYGQYAAEARIEIARLEAQIPTTADFWRVSNWCRDIALAEMYLDMYARRVSRDRLRIIAVSTEAL